MKMIRWEVAYRGAKHYFDTLEEACEWAQTTVSAAAEYSEQLPEVKISAFMEGEDE